VTVNGTSVTVSPTDELGNTFDVQTYDFGTSAPNTVIDSAPPAQAAATSATFAFHATATPATFACTLDGGAAAPCTSPASYASLADGPHTFSVAATTSSGTDQTPASNTWTVDTAPPSNTTAAAAAASPTSVNVTWVASTDNLGVSAYDVTRDGVPVASVAGNTTSYTDAAATPATSYQYAVRAHDAAGNTSDYAVAPSVTTPSPPTPVFSDGFESGSLSAWTSFVGLGAETSNVHSGAFAVEGNTTNGGTYAKKTLPTTFTDGFARLYFNVPSFASQVNLLRFRDAAGNSLGYLFVGTNGLLGLRDDVTGATLTSTTSVGTGWHAFEFHMRNDGTTNAVDAWLDDVLVDGLSASVANSSAAPIGQIQIGEVQTGRTYDLLIDDVVFATQRIGR
jgi:hypothetical protein